jgi:hypothetical protein
MTSEARPMPSIVQEVEVIPPDHYVRLNANESMALIRVEELRLEREKLINERVKVRWLTLFKISLVAGVVALFVL